jgi:hypothetical protein
MSFHVPEKFRMPLPKTHPLHSTVRDGNNGAFIVELKKGHKVFVIASDGGGWEHVSVSQDDRKSPSWEVMCEVKALFWDAEDCVVQYHPPESSYINNHPGCLHLWRPTEDEMPVPPTYMVGYKEFNLN